MTVFLHIGMQKTGTTSIQSFFATNRTLLRKNGFNCPKFTGRVNHTKLAAYAHSEGFRKVDQRAGVNSPETRERFRERLQRTDGHILFSSEHCIAI